MHIWVVFGAAERRHQLCTLNYDIEGAADLGQWFSTMLSTNQPGYGKTVYLWFLGMSVRAEMHSNASVVRLLWKRLIAQKADAPAFYLMVVSVSWQMFTLANSVLFFPSAASQPPMLWHLIYILISRVQDREACCKNTIQTVPADRKVRSVHETDVLWRCRWGGEHKNITFSLIFIKLVFLAYE